MQEKLVSLVAELKATVAESDEKDEALADLVDRLDAYVETHEDPLPSEKSQDIRDTLLLIEVRLNESHPLATRISESVVNILSAMGI